MSPNRGPNRCRNLKGLGIKFRDGSERSSSGIGGSPRLRIKASHSCKSRSIAFHLLRLKVGRGTPICKALGAAEGALLSGGGCAF